MKQDPRPVTELRFQHGVSEIFVGIHFDGNVCKYFPVVLILHMRFLLAYFHITSGAGATNISGMWGGMDGSCIEMLFSLLSRVAFACYLTCNYQAFGFELDDKRESFLRFSM